MFRSPTTNSRTGRFTGGGGYEYARHLNILLLVVNALLLSVKRYVGSIMLKQPKLRTCKTFSEKTTIHLKNRIEKTCRGATGCVKVVGAPQFLNCVKLDESQNLTRIALISSVIFYLE